MSERASEEDSRLDDRSGVPSWSIGPMTEDKTREALLMLHNMIHEGLVGRETDRKESAERNERVDQRFDALELGVATAVSVSRSLAAARALDQADNAPIFPNGTTRDRVLEVRDELRGAAKELTDRLDRVNRTSQSALKLSKEAISEAHSAKRQAKEADESGKHAAQAYERISEHAIEVVMGDKIEVHKERRAWYRQKWAWVVAVGMLFLSGGTAAAKTIITAWFTVTGKK